MLIVSNDEVARYYIQCELDNIIEGKNIHLRSGLYNTNMPRLLEALSFTYRANSVFDYVASKQFQWEKREIPVDDIVLTAMGGELTDIIYSDQVQQSPRKFIDYIQSHQNDERLKQLGPRRIPDDRKTLMLREHEGKHKMLDGSHRFLSMIMNGADNVTCYVAVLINEEAKPMIGDATFLRLRGLWERTEDTEFKISIEQTVLGMMGSTENGLASVEAYWINMAPNERVRKVGERLINALNSKMST
jgi:hypothetical protein